MPRPAAVSAARGAAAAARMELDALQGEDDKEWLLSIGDAETAARLGGKSLQSAFGIMFGGKQAYPSPPLPPEPPPGAGGGGRQRGGPAADRAATAAASRVRRSLRAAVAEHRAVIRMRAARVTGDYAVLAVIWGFLPHRPLTRCALTCSRWLSAVSSAPACAHGVLLACCPAAPPGYPGGGCAGEGLSGCLGGWRDHPFWARRGPAALLLRDALSPVRGAPLPQGPSGDAPDSPGTQDAVKEGDALGWEWEFRVGEDTRGRSADFHTDVRARWDSPNASDGGGVSYGGIAIRDRGNWVLVPEEGLTVRLLELAEWTRDTAAAWGCGDDPDVLFDALRCVLGLALPPAFPSAVLCAMTPLAVQRDLLYLDVIPTARRLEPYLAEHVVSMLAGLPVPELRRLCGDSELLAERLTAAATRCATEGVVEQRLRELVAEGHHLFPADSALQRPELAMELREAERVTGMERERRAARYRLTRSEKEEDQS
eukprot:TRINITY_DN32754_c0_g1_i1.p1 TRINITY_DN32754_c0_g1~~TRINITY_DN32754_c0_g1_i1.p1  ORF type:complete len:514 (+),score=151.54 TRINITY_DN32754_c0_g1_i1:88-1542(+)